MTPITGLPPYLNAIGPTASPQGVGTVAYRSSDGAIIVGTVATAGGPTLGNVELFLFYLNGSAIDSTRTRQISLGTTPATGGAWVTVMPDDRILVAGGPITGGLMANNLFAIVQVDPSTPVPIVTLPLNPPISTNGQGGGTAVDPSGRFIYIASTVNPGQATMVASLHRWEWAINSVCVIANWPAQLAQGLCCDDDGSVYVSASSLAPPAHFIHKVTPSGCNPATITTTPTTAVIAPSGIALDRANPGRFLVQAAGFAPGFPVANRNTVWSVDPANGTATFVAGGPATWGGIGRSPAVNNAIDSYGTCTDGQNRYWFANFPNPGGQPTIGNQNFSLTMAASSTAGTTTSALALSFGRGSMRMFGIELLIDLGTTSLTFFPPAPYSLPIPNNPIYLGMVLTAQSLHLEANNTLAASRGLSFTVH